MCDGATQQVHSSVDLQLTSYECLDRIMHLYYYKMEEYMSSYVFNVSLEKELLRYPPFVAYTYNAL